MYLQFLTSSSFVLSWYISGIMLAGWVVYDELYINTPVNKSLKVGWPIIIIFFSIIGFLLYLLTCRPKEIANLTDDKKKKVHHIYVNKVFSKVTGSVIHCVAGDGLGIISPMVVGRWVGLSFWSEFAAEYITGFLFGWILFQYPAMRSMKKSPKQSLWMGGRAEFFSMITLMTGMLITIKFIQPYIIPISPLPDSYAFWGVASLALFIGTIVTYPMNWWLVSIGWKHGMT